MGYLIEAERTDEKGVTTRRALLNCGPRLTAAQNRYGWIQTAPARKATDEDRRNIVRDSLAIEG